MSGGFQFMGNAVCQKPFKTVAIVAAGLDLAADLPEAVALTDALVRYLRCPAR